MPIRADLTPQQQEAELAKAMWFLSCRELLAEDPGNNGAPLPRGLNPQQQGDQYRRTLATRVERVPYGLSPMMEGPIVSIGEDGSVALAHNNGKAQPQPQQQQGQQAQHPVFALMDNIGAVVLHSAINDYSVHLAKERLEGMGFAPADQYMYSVSNMVEALSMTSTEKLKAMRSEVELQSPIDRVQEELQMGANGLHCRWPHEEKEDLVRIKNAPPLPADQAPHVAEIGPPRPVKDFAASFAATTYKREVDLTLSDGARLAYHLRSHPFERRVRREEFHGSRRPRPL